MLFPIKLRIYWYMNGIQGKCWARPRRKLSRAMICTNIHPVVLYFRNIVFQLLVILKKIKWYIKKRKTEKENDHSFLHISIYLSIYLSIYPQKYERVSAQEGMIIFFLSFFLCVCVCVCVCVSDEMGKYINLKSNFLHVLKRELTQCYNKWCRFSLSNVALYYLGWLIYQSTFLSISFSSFLFVCQFIQFHSISFHWWWYFSISPFLSVCRKEWVKHWKHWIFGWLTVTFDGVRIHFQYPSTNRKCVIFKVFPDLEQTNFGSV